MSKVAILQSSYIPWKGYFDLVNYADHFILYDDAQYTKNDWRNRNIIKTSNGPSWLTIPIQHKNLSQTIFETVASDGFWRKKHWKTICQAYSKATFFNFYKDAFEDCYLSSEELSLSSINYSFLRLINELLGINTKIYRSNEFSLLKGKTERLVGLCKNLGGDIYLSGPAAKSYLNESLFKEEGIGVEWMDYSGYPEYSQLYPPFMHGVSILDLLFNEGPNAKNFMKSFALDSL